MTDLFNCTERVYSSIVELLMALTIHFLVSVFHSFVVMQCLTHSPFSQWVAVSIPGVCVCVGSPGTSASPHRKKRTS